MRYRWNRYTGKWSTRNGEEKVHAPEAIRASTFLKRWLRCVKTGESLQFFLRDYPWLSRAACQKRMRRMRKRLADEQGILLPMLLWQRPPLTRSRSQDTGEWAKIYRAVMDQPPEPPDLDSTEIAAPQRPVRTAEHRSRTITRDPLRYRADR